MLMGRVTLQLRLNLCRGTKATKRRVIEEDEGHKGKELLNYGVDDSILDLSANLE